MVAHTVTAAAAVVVAVEVENSVTPPPLDTVEVGMVIGVVSVEPLVLSRHQGPAGRLLACNLRHCPRDWTAEPEARHSRGVGDQDRLRLRRKTVDSPASTTGGKEAETVLDQHPSCKQASLDPRDGNNRRSHSHCQHAMISVPIAFARAVVSSGASPVLVAADLPVKPAYSPSTALATCASDAADLPSASSFQQCFT